MAISSDALPLSVYFSNVPAMRGAAFAETHAKAGPTDADIAATNAIPPAFPPNRAFFP